MATRIAAFLDGNTFVHYNEYTGRLIGGNSGGLVKVFDPDADTEPTSIDIPENVTAMAANGEKLLIATSSGELSLLKVAAVARGDEAYETIYKSDSPLRDVVFINEGKRSICGGDKPFMTVVDHMNLNQTTEVSLLARPVGLAYNPSGEVVAVSLDNGEVHIFSVINEKPVPIHVISGTLPAIEASNDVYAKCAWVLNGEQLLVPTRSGSVKTFLRSDWSHSTEILLSEKLASLAVSPSTSQVSLLYYGGNLDFFLVKDGRKLSSLRDNNIEGTPTNIAWTKNSVYFGATSGELYSVQVSFQDEPVVSKEVELLFIDEAEDSDAELAQPTSNGKKHALDDEDIIDEEDDDLEDAYKYYNKSVEDFLHSNKKKARFESNPAAAPPPALNDNIVPYSPGSTPWISSNNSANKSSKRRYLFMSSIGYSWSVSNSNSAEEQKSITVSFFDRSINKDYHFIDYNNFDLCCMNEKGILFGCSGFEKEDKTSPKGKISYRHHLSTHDSWERQIPLVKGEYLTSVALTNTADSEAGESLIVVGTNLGYLRFFNLYGLCINLMKTSPIVASIASVLDTIFIIHQAGHNSYTYSIINVAEDYSFVQQERPLSLRSGEGPLIKGLFYNEYSDPCLVAGNDDTLTILSHWREPNNARWVPVLNCKEIVTDFGLTKSKKNWSTWPLGFQEEKFVALVLKNSDSYPGFPLPLPVDFPARMPVKCYRSIIEQSAEDESEEALEQRLAKIQEEDPEEEFLRASTFGKLLSSSLADLDNEDDQMEKLSGFSVAFDKSLLKLFNSACQSSRLNKAFSIVKLIKNDKALLAATRIGERHNFNNLVVKISKLREDLMEMEEEE